MDEPIEEIGSFEAKTRLSRLLRETEQGRSFLILRRGKPVARLVPPGPESSRSDLADLIERFRALRAKVKAPIDVVELVREGRDR